MEINRPSSPELTPEQQAAMEHFRQRVHALTLNGGLTPDTVRNVVLADEAQELREIAPGQSLLDLG
jgi:hypothetical protein